VRAMKDSSYRFVSRSTSRVGSHVTRKSLGALLAVLATCAVVAAPAQAAATHCKGVGVGWSATGESASLGGTMCYNASSAWCQGSVAASASVSWWNLVTSVKGITRGCFYGSTKYGKAETMWANVTFKFSNPVGSSTTETVYLRAYMTPSGSVHYSTSVG
jgi:hypothetical protein